MRTLAIAALQTSPVAQDPQSTFERFEHDVHAVASTFDEVQLVTVPELHLSAAGHVLREPHGYAAEVAVDIPGAETERLARLALDTGLWLVPGSLYERDGDHVRNTAIVLSPDGELVTVYRKCFPWAPYETSRPGTELATFDIPEVGRIGLAICYDGAFPEIPRQLAWWGAEVMLQPMLTGTSDRDGELAVARATAIVNQMAVVNLNAASPTGGGRSAIVDAEGIVRYEAGAGEEVLIDVLDLDAVARARQRGSFGMNKLWQQWDEQAATLELPMYGAPAARPVEARA
ncbi:carbon-nitrogen hydrolase family protein [Candidatus Solirubrobacter pratensis]|uniref:carbon-nitrogen hydrolase family protein n=1 Tax=Candidatus Solirubrobacter pratensis TaxID=1298857 RepID=UPI00041BCFBB|nr:carbon-nitrogen hydrolase family protein [Candidatus Solirubrobacter pratensis]